MISYKAKNQVTVFTSSQTQLPTRPDTSEYGDNRSVRATPSPSPRDSLREISALDPRSIKEKDPRGQLPVRHTVRPKQARALHSLLNDLSELSRSGRRPSSLPLDPRKGWEARRSTNRRQKSLSSTSSIESELEAEETEEEPWQQWNLYEMPRRHSSVILRRDSLAVSDNDESDVLERLKIAYLRAPAFPPFENGIYFHDPPCKDLNYHKTPDIFQPHLEDYVKTLERKLYKCLLQHWTEEAKDSDSETQLCLKPEEVVRPRHPKGILIRRPPRGQTRNFPRKNVTFVPGTVFAERNYYSPFWLKIYVQKEQRRALKGLGPQAASVLTRRRVRCRKRGCQKKSNNRRDTLETNLPASGSAQREPRQRPKMGSRFLSGVRNFFSNLQTFFRSSYRTCDMRRQSER